MSDEASTSGSKRPLAEREAVRCARDRGRGGARGHIARALPVLVFLSCLAVASFAIGLVARLALPPRPATDLFDKLADLAAEAAHADTIAVGSSRMLTTFDPAAFDAAAAASGCNMRSHNLAVGGLNLVEMEYLLRELRARHPENLKRLIFDPPNRIQIEYRHLHSRRVHLTTDPLAAMTALADIVSHPNPRMPEALIRYAGAFLFHNSSIGAFSTLLHPEQGDGRPDERSTLRGFLPLAKEAAPTEQRRAMLADSEFARSVEITRRTIAEIGRTPPAKARLRMRVIGDLADTIQSYGYEPVLLILPQAYPEAAVDARTLEAGFRDTRPGALVVNTMSPGYPVDVLAFHAWYDFTHVHRDVARSISSHLGAEICRTRRLF